VSLWWLQPGWDQTRCAQCGAKIWPEGDPDWGVCVACFAPPEEQYPEQQYPEEEEAQHPSHVPPVPGDKGDCQS